MVTPSAADERRVRSSLRRKRASSFGRSRAVWRQRGARACLHGQMIERQVRVGSAGGESNTGTASRPGESSRSFLSFSSDMARGVGVPHWRRAAATYVPLPLIGSLVAIVHDRPLGLVLSQ